MRLPVRLGLLLTQVMQTVQLATEASSGLVGSFANAYLVGSAAALLGAGAATFVRSRAGRRAQVPLRRSSP